MCTRDTLRCLSVTEETEQMTNEMRVKNILKANRIKKDRKIIS